VEVRNHQVVFEEPLGATGVILLPPNRFDIGSLKTRCGIVHRQSGSLGAGLGERAGAPEFKAVRDQRGAALEFQAHPLAAGVPADVAVVEEALEATRDLLTGAADESADVSGFE